MNKQRAYNKMMEKQNLVGTAKQRRKKYKKIIEEMGVRNITLDDITNRLDKKKPGIIDMMNETEMTFDELVVLQQYGNAILNGDTRSAEFLRDSVGEKPSTQLDVTSTDESGLSKMSYEELVELRDLLKKQNK